MRPALALLVALAACRDPPADEASPAPATTTGPQDGPPIDPAQAQRDALARLIPLAIAALQRADPVASARLGLSPIAPPPFQPRRRNALRDALDAASKQADGVDEKLLAPADAMLVRAIRFGLLRARDRHVRWIPWRLDPTTAMAALGDFVDELEARLAAGPCDDCVHAVSVLPDEIGHIAAELRATSPSSLAAARADLATLVARLERLAPRLAHPSPKVEGAVGATVGSLRELDERWARVEAGLTAAKPLAWGDRRVPSASGPESVLRMPDVIGAAELRRRLEVEEGVATTPEASAQDLARALEHFGALSRSEPATTTARAAVDPARCERRWSAIEAALREMPALAAATLDCAVAVRRMEGDRLDDAELTVRLVELGVVEPVARQRRSAQPPALALVGGEIAPAAHRIALSLAVLAKLGDGGARRLVLRRAVDELCTSLAAMRIHGELPDTIGVNAMPSVCAKEIDWATRARARPRAAMIGLGVVVVAGTDTTALDRFPWAPLGLLPDLARAKEPAP